MCARKHAKQKLKGAARMKNKKKHRKHPTIDSISIFIVSKHVNRTTATQKYTSKQDSKCVHKRATRRGMYALHGNGGIFSIYNRASRQNGKNQTLQLNTKTLHSNITIHSF